MGARGAGLLLVLALLPGIPGAAADFKLVRAEPALNQRALHVNARFDLPLKPPTEEALNKGIPLDLIFDVNLVKHRWWWRNKVITDWALRRRIQFHALSRQYLVSGLTEFDSSESFTSLAPALKHLGSLDNLVIPLTAKKDIEGGARYLLQLRTRLDIESLPTLMRPIAYATPAWRLNSGWTEWPVQH